MFVVGQLFNIFSPVSSVLVFTKPGGSLALTLLVCCLLLNPTRRKVYERVWKECETPFHIGLLKEIRHFIKKGCIRSFLIFFSTPTREGSAAESYGGERQRELHCVLAALNEKFKGKDEKLEEVTKEAHFLRIQRLFYFYSEFIRALPLKKKRMQRESVKRAKLCAIKPKSWRHLNCRSGDSSESFHWAALTSLTSLTSIQQRMLCSQTLFITHRTLFPEFPKKPNRRLEECVWKDAQDDETLQPGFECFTHRMAFMTILQKMIFYNFNATKVGERQRALTPLEELDGSLASAVTVFHITGIISQVLLLQRVNSQRNGHFLLTKMLLDHPATQRKTHWAMLTAPV